MQRSVSIAAASIMAKVFRDDYMTQLSKDYPNTVLKMWVMVPNNIYEQSMISAFTKEHRKSFEPIKSLL